MKLKTISLLILLNFVSLKAWSEQIKFPQEELATESVLPVFDQPQAVKNRLVSLAGRFEIGAGMSYDLVEPFFTPYGFNGQASYNFNETHGISLFYANYLQGTTSYVNQLNNIPNTSSKFNLQYAPPPKFMFIADYQYTAFYGKMSFAKDFVMNLSLYGLLGAGTIQIGDSSNPLVNIGLGQKFYFSPHHAIRFDLRFNYYNGPNVVSGNLQTATSVQSASTFSTRSFFGSVLSAAYTYIF